MVEGQPESERDKRKVLFVLIVFIIIGIGVYIVFRSGWPGLGAFFKKMLNWLIFFAIMGAIIYLVWKILQKPKVDLVAKSKQDIIDAGCNSKPPMLRDLYFTGDKEHGEFKVGKIIGYCQIQSYKDLNQISNLTEEQISKLQKANVDPSKYILNEDCFIWKKMPWPFSMFEEPKVLRTLEDEHTQLVGDVKIYAVSMIKKFDYYWPNRAFLDTARIDISVIREAWRGHIHEFLSDEVAIARKSVGLDSGHQKDIESRKLLKIPTSMGEQERRGM